MNSITIRELEFVINHIRQDVTCKSEAVSTLATVYGKMIYDKVSVIQLSSLNQDELALIQSVLDKTTVNADPVDSESPEKPQ